MPTEPTDQAYRCLTCGRTALLTEGDNFPRDDELCSHEWEAVEPLPTEPTVSELQAQLAAVERERDVLRAIIEAATLESVDSVSAIKLRERLCDLRDSVARLTRERDEARAERDRLVQLNRLMQLDVDMLQSRADDAEAKVKSLERWCDSSKQVVRLEKRSASSAVKRAMDAEAKVKRLEEAARPFACDVHRSIRDIAPVQLTYHLGGILTNAITAADVRRLNTALAPAAESSEPEIRREQSSVLVQSVAQALALQLESLGLHSNAKWLRVTADDYADLERRLAAIDERCSQCLVPATGDLTKAERALCDVHAMARDGLSRESRPQRPASPAEREA